MTVMTVRTRVLQAIALLVLLPSASYGATLSQPGTLPRPVVQTLAKQRLPASSLSVYVQDVKARSPILAYNDDRPRNPASVIKILTTFAALDLLGPTYTWKTEAFGDGPINNGHLNGNLTLKGSGDPFLVTETFSKLLRGLRDRGIRDIAGDLVIDSNFFALPRHDPGAFDGKPLRPYNVGANALLLNFQTVGFTFVPNRITKNVQIAADPPPANLKIHNNLKYIGGKCRGPLRHVRMKIASAPKVTAVNFTGKYPASCGKSVLYRVVLEPDQLLYGVFKTLWRELGGSLRGGLRKGATPANAQRLSVLTSRPLAEQIRDINKYSNNVMARQLLLTMGAEHAGAPATLEKGRTAITVWLRKQGLNFPGLFLDNGSGLSRQTRISARNLGQLLVHAHKHPFVAEFISSLPLSAVDGTLRKRFRGEPLARQVRMKTGTINDVRAIAGYLSSQSGRTFAVAILQNHPGVHRGTGTQVQNALLRWLSQR